MTARTDAITNAAQEAAGMDSEQGWRGIESAPRDGTEIWAFNGEQARMRWSEGDEWALWVWADDLLADVDPSPIPPTHWRPLPPPPSEAGDG